MIFEDSPNFIISEFIRSGYSKEEADNIIFSGGNNKLISELDKVDRHETCLIYIDVIPDNKNSVRIYKNLVDKVKSENRKETFILPIPSIEFIVLKGIGNLNEIDSNVVFNTYKYKSTDLYINVMHCNCNSFEVYTKAVLNHRTNVCKRPKSKSVHSLKYYTEDCLCSTAYSDCNTSINIVDKAWEVIRCLPAFMPSDANEKHFGKVDNMKPIINSCIQDYNRMLVKFIEYGYVETAYMQKLILDYI